MVVGIRQTSRAVSTSDRRLDRRSSPRTGTAWRTTTTKTAVSESSRTLSATSLGVFCRSDPSTRAIIRSTNEWPGLGGDPDDDPVGEHHGAAGDRAPVAAGLADHRGGLAGHRGLVDGGHALDDVTVAGDPLPGLHDDHVAGPQACCGDLLDGQRRPGCRCSASWSQRRATRRAVVSCWSSRRLAACALPRPSATASARVPKSTVSQSQTRDETENSAPGRATAITVVATAPISTTSMTGLPRSSRGLDLGEREDGQRRRDGAGCGGGPDPGAEWVLGVHARDSAIGPRASTGT